jgi:hypothetical protein
VLHCVKAIPARGLNNQQLAERLMLSLKTVRNHIVNIFSKGLVTDCAQALLRAREAGLCLGKGKEGDLLFIALLQIAAFYVYFSYFFPAISALSHKLLHR